MTTIINLRDLDDIALVQFADILHRCAGRHAVDGDDIREVRVLRTMEMVELEMFNRAPRATGGVTA